MDLPTRKIMAMKPGTHTSKMVNVTFDLTGVTEDEILEIALRELSMRVQIKMRRDWRAGDPPPSKMVFDVKADIVRVGLMT